MKNYFSTGEISKILNISRATVSRKFDMGIFTGNKNPITGERLISRESLFSFMQKYNLPITKFDNDSQINVLLGSNNSRLQSIIKKALLEDNQFKVDIVSSGYDALIKCSQFENCIFLLDEELPNFDCVRATKIIKANKNLAGIKIICIVKSINSCKENKCVNDKFLINNDINSKNLKDKIINFLGITKTNQQEPASFDHQRSWPRIELGIPASIEIFIKDSPDLREMGDSIIENISLGGAYLKNINLEDNKIPFGSIRLILNIKNPPLKNLKEECKVVRLHANGSLDAGVQFIDLNQKTRDQILKLYG